MNITVTGTLALDYIMDFPGLFSERIMPDAIHKLSLSFLVDKLNRQFGGTAGNIAYTLRLLGGDPFILSSAGTDFALYAKHLAKYKISRKHILLDKKESTSSFFVVTDKNHNQIGSFYIGASRRTPELSVAAVGEQFVVLAPTVPEAMVKFVSECRKAKLPYMYDPAFQIGVFTPEQLRAGIEGAEILIANDYEMKLLTEKLNLSHEDLRVMVPVLVTTLGDKGAIVETRRESIYIRPAKPKSNLDPTGAGDAFRAGFVCGWLRKLPLATCGQMGAVAAVYTVEKYGTQTHEFTRPEFEKRYEENYGEKITL